MISKNHVFSVYSHLCMYTATHPHTIYLDWLQAMLESNSRSAWKWRLTELREILQGRNQASLEMHSEAVTGHIWRYTWRLWLSKFGDTLGGWDLGSLEIHLESVIERGRRYTWRPWSSDYGDALAGRNGVNLKGVIVRLWRYTWRVWSCELRNALRDRHRASLEMHLKAMIVWTCRP